MVSGLDFCAHARTWLGVPWLHQGRSRQGVDCVGLLLGVAGELGVGQVADVPPADYGRQPAHDRLRTLAMRYLAPLERVQPGAVVLLRFEAEPSHVGIVADYHVAAGELALIHAYEPRGRVLEHRLAPEWRARIDGVFAVHGVSYER